MSKHALLSPSAAHRWLNCTPSARLCFQAQVDYYTKCINERSDLQFYSIFTDEGISGCTTKERAGFQQMLADGLAGKFQLLVTKSVSRFTRNTVDSLTAIRQLRDAGCEVYFEKEQIWTFDGKGKLLVTIMASLAQDESRTRAGTSART